jgi:hypothetical protein
MTELVWPVVAAAVMRYAVPPLLHLVDRIARSVSRA